MSNIPNDPYILLSFLNMKLRNNYRSLEALCSDLNVDETEIITKMRSVGYEYDPEKNAFV